MTVAQDIRQLRSELKSLSSTIDPELIRPHVLRIPTAERLSLYRRTRMLVGRILRAVGIMRRRKLEPWVPTLKHAPGAESANTWVIWAIGADRQELRRACLAFAEFQGELPRHLPVLVTDVADFAFYSRLGWLVEYVPSLADDDGYRDRKRQYLAWRYRASPAVPVSAGLVPGISARDLRIV